jgi:hypothetical protein
MATASYPCYSASYPCYSANAPAPYGGCVDSGVCELRFEKPIDLSLLGYMASDLAIRKVVNDDVAKQVETWAKVIKGFSASVYNEKATSLARLFTLLNFLTIPGRRAVFEKLICFIQQSGVSDSQSDYNDSVTKATAIAAYTGIYYLGLTQFSADIAQYFCNPVKFPSLTLPNNAIIQF